MEQREGTSGRWKVWSREREQVGGMEQREGTSGRWRVWSGEKGQVGGGGFGKERGNRLEVEGLEQREGTGGKWGLEEREGSRSEVESLDRGNSWKVKVWSR